MDMGCGKNTFMGIPTKMEKPGENHGRVISYRKIPTDEYGNTGF